MYVARGRDSKRPLEACELGAGHELSALQQEVRRNVLPRVDADSSFSQENRKCRANTKTHKTI